MDDIFFKRITPTSRKPPTMPNPAAAARRRARTVGARWSGRASGSHGRDLPSRSLLRRVLREAEDAPPSASIVGAISGCGPRPTRTRVALRRVGHAAADDSHPRRRGLPSALGALDRSYRNSTPLHQARTALAQPYRALRIGGRSDPVTVATHPTRGRHGSASKDTRPVRPAQCGLLRGANGRYPGAGARESSRWAREGCTRISWSVNGCEAAMSWWHVARRHHWSGSQGKGPRAFRSEAVNPTASAGRRGRPDTSPRNGRRAYGVPVRS